MVPEFRRIIITNPLLLLLLSLLSNVEYVQALVTGYDYDDVYIVMSYNGLAREWFLLLLLLLLLFAITIHYSIIFHMIHMKYDCLRM